MCSMYCSRIMLKCKCIISTISNQLQVYLLSRLMPFCEKPDTFANDIMKELENYETQHVALCCKQKLSQPAISIMLRHLAKRTKFVPRMYSTIIEPEPIFQDNIKEELPKKSEEEKVQDLKKRKFWTWVSIVAVSLCFTDHSTIECLIAGTSSQYFVYQFLKKQNIEQKQIELEIAKKRPLHR
jgi:hypothetical protein